jgi:hypothetical protein
VKQHTTQQIFSHLNSRPAEPREIKALRLSHHSHEAARISALCPIQLSDSMRCFVDRFQSTLEH